MVTPHGRRAARLVGGGREGRICMLRDGPGGVGLSGMVFRSTREGSCVLGVGLAEGAGGYASSGNLLVCFG